MSGSVIDALTEAAAGFAGVQTVDFTATVPHSDLALRTESAFAFFRLAQPDNIVERWRETQREVASFIQREGQDRNTFLTLLVQGHGDPYTLQSIQGNPYVCRKLVYNGIDEPLVRGLVNTLPFLPLPAEFDQVMRRLPPDPISISLGTGLGPEFVGALLARDGVDELAERLLHGDFDVPATAASAGGGQGAAVGTGAGRQRGRLGVRELTLHGFRNYESQNFTFCDGLNVIYGRNGTGKTSICEALEWVLTGESSRVEQDSKHDHAVSDQVLARFHPGAKSTTVQALLSGDGAPPLIERRLGPDSGQSNLRLGAQLRRDRDLLLRLINLPNEDVLERVNQLRPVFRYCQFLAQHTIQEFLADKPEERYEAFARIIGTQDLLRVFQRAREVQLVLQRGIQDAQGKTADLAEQVSTANALWEERQAQLRRRSGGRIVTHELLAATGQQVLRQAAPLGFTAEPPESHATLAWRALAQSLLQWMPTRQSGLQDQKTNLVHLIQENLAAVDALRARPAAVQQLKEADARHQRARQALAAASAEQERVRVEADEAEEQVGQLGAHHKALQESHTIAGQLRVVAAGLSQFSREQSILQAELDIITETGKRIRGKQEALELERSALAQTLYDLNERYQGLQAVRSKLETWRQMAGELAGAHRELATLEEQRRQLAGRLPTLDQEIEALRQQLTGQRSRLAEAETLVAERERLLTALAQGLESDEHQCPLCSHNWGDHRRLLAAMQNTLQTLPESLRDLRSAVAAAQRRQDAATERLQALREQDDRLKAQANRWQGTALDLTFALSDARNEVSAFFGQVDPEALDADAVAAALRDVEQKRTDVQHQLAQYDQRSRKIQAELDQQAERYKERRRAQEEIVRELARLQSESDQLTAQRSALGVSEPPEDAQAALAHSGQERQAAARALTSLRRQFDQARAVVAGREKEEQATARQLSVLAERVHSLEDRVARHQAALSALLDPTPPVERADAALREQLRYVTGLEQTAGQLTDTVASFLAQAEARNLADEAEAVAAEMHGLLEHQSATEAEIERAESCRNRVADLLTRAQALLRSEEQERKDHLEPLMGNIYQRLCGHPNFGELRIEIADNKLHVRVKSLFTEAAQDQVPVAAYFSQAQRNAVAVSNFLAAALLQGWTRLGTLCIDDPIQHMDEMNVFAFLDLLETLVDSGRQLIITTASEELYRTMVGRFSRRNADKVQRFRAMRLLGVTREGPKVVVDTDDEAAD